jgi:hypothetical protein
VLSEEATNANFIVFGLNPRSTTLNASTLTNTPHAVIITIDVATVNVKAFTSVINKNELEIGMKHFCVRIEIKYDINSLIILIKYLYL